MTCRYTTGNVKLVDALQRLSEALTRMKKSQSQTSYRKVLSVQVLAESTTSSASSGVKFTLLKGQGGEAAKATGEPRQALSLCARTKTTSVARSEGE